MNELNYVLTRILDMDNRAAQVKEEAQKQLEQMELDTKEIRSTMKKTMTDQLEARLKEYREQVVSKAESESQQILERAQKEGEAMNQAYAKNKDSLIKDALQRISAGS